MPDKDLVKTYLGDHLAQWFIVSKVTLTDENLPEVLGFNVDVELSVERPVLVAELVETTHGEDGLCDRCYHVLKD